MTIFPIICGFLCFPFTAQDARAGELFRRGNANGAGGVDISDAIWNLRFLFSGGAPPPCPDAADANDDGSVDISDSLFILGYLFFGSAPPPAPGPTVCGMDPTADALGPCVDPGCGATTCIDLSFSAFFGPAVIVASLGEAADAAALRSGTPVYSYLEARLAADAASSEKLLVLESYHVESGNHGFFYARVRAGGLVVDAATNMSVVPRSFGPATSEPGAISELTVAMSSDIETLFTSLAASPASSGAGGDGGVDGGTTHFLSFEEAGTCVQHALYGLDFFVHGPTFGPPGAGPDLTRYVQTEMGFELWLEIFSPGAAVIALAGLGVDMAAGEGGGAGGGGGIVVNGSRAFKRSVLAALQAISPCYIIEIGNDCRVTLTSPADFEAFCECYCQHMAGTNLIEDLALGDGTTAIEETAGGNRHNRGTVSWNPDSTQGGLNADGNRNRPPKIGLAHEMIHAKHTHCGTRGAGEMGGISNEEINTSRGENQIRGECGQPKRTHYGANEIPNNCDENLDDSNRFDCRCP
jgi:hypothetical protein